MWYAAKMKAPEGRQGLKYGNSSVEDIWDQRAETLNSEGLRLKLCVRKYQQMLSRAWMIRQFIKKSTENVWVTMLMMFFSHKFAQFR